MRKRSSFIVVVILFALAACDLYQYGKLGGADQTVPFFPGDPEFEALLSSLSSPSGVWYSHYAGIGRLDGYRIGRWSDFDALVRDTGKTTLIPNMVNPPETYTAESGGAPGPSGGSVPGPGDYFVFYDSSVYGQADDNSPPAAGWEWNLGFCGIVRGINLFYGDQNRGALIIEYLKGCAPTWDADIKDGQLPFFGIYYRFLDPDIVQIANAVDLAALYNGEKYYTETATLQEAMDTNTVENEAEFIAWGVVIPQDREQ
jgi:hypothetical protein